jgi:hypothetical protein
VLQLDRSNRTTSLNEGATPMTTLRRFIARIDAHTLWAFNAPRSLRG